MRKRNEFKVGIIVIASILVLVAVYWFLGGLSVRGASYRINAYFSDVMKLDKGSDVRLSGVPIGLVEDIGLDENSRAYVKLLIWKKYDIPSDSVARVTSGGLIGDTYVEVIPGSKGTVLVDGDTIKARKLVQYTEIMEGLDKLLKKLQITADSVNTVMGDEDLMGSVKSTMENMDKTSQETAALVAELKDVVQLSTPRIRHIMANLDRASENAALVSRQVEQMMGKDMQPRVKGILQHVSKIAENLDTTIASAKDLMETAGTSKQKVDAALDKVTLAAGQAEQILTKLNELVADTDLKDNIKKTVKNTADITEGLKDIVGDKEVQGQLRKTIKNAAEVSESAKTVVALLNQTLKGKQGITPEQQAQIPDYGASIYSLWNTGTNKARFDANYTFNLGPPRSFYRVGAYNIGEKTGLTLQAGEALGGGSAFRYGLYASKVGLGFDRMFSKRYKLSAELFDPNDAQLELRGTVEINDVLSAYLGLEDVIHSDRRNVLLGVQYKK